MVTLETCFELPLTLASSLKCVISPAKRCCSCYVINILGLGLGHISLAWLGIATKKIIFVMILILLTRSIGWSNYPLLKSVQKTETALGDSELINQAFQLSAETTNVSVDGTSASYSLLSNQSSMRTEYSIEMYWFFSFKFQDKKISQVLLVQPNFLLHYIRLILLKSMSKPSSKVRWRGKCFNTYEPNKIFHWLLLVSEAYAFDLIFIIACFHSWTFNFFELVKLLESYSFVFLLTF